MLHLSHITLSLDPDFARILTIIRFLLERRCHTNYFPSFISKVTIRKIQSHNTTFIHTINNIEKSIDRATIKRMYMYSIILYSFSLQVLHKITLHSHPLQCYECKYVEPYSRIQHE